MNILHERYQKEIAPALFKAFSFKNVMQVPRIEKVVVNIGLGEALDNPKALEAGVSDLTIITGQKPVTTVGPQEHRQLQAARRPLDRSQGHLAGRPHVGLPRPLIEHCTAACA